MRPPLKLEGLWPSGASGEDRFSPPVVASGIAVAVSSTGVAAFDPSTGAARWSIARVGGSVFSPALDLGTGAVVYTEGSGGRTSAVVAVEAATGQRMWAVPLGGPARSAPSISGDQVVLGAGDQYLYDVDVTTRSLRWRVRTAGSVNAAPAVADGTVFAISEDAATGRARLYAIDLQTHRSVWAFSPPNVSIGVTAVSVASGTVFAGFGDQYVRAFDAATGRVKWAAPVRGDFSPSSSPAFAARRSFGSGALFIADRLGGLYRFDAATGKRRWDYQFPDAVTFGSPLVWGGVVYLGIDDGTIGAVDGSTGRLTWQTRLRFGAVTALVPAGQRVLAVSLDRGSRIASFVHDPRGGLVDRASPSTIDFTRSLTNFGAAFVVVALFLLGGLQLLVRRRRRELPGAGIAAESNGGMP